MTTLTADISADKLVNALHAALGAEHVCTAAVDLDRYSKCTIPWQSMCSAVVFPGSTEEVAAVLRIANEHRVPVWPSSGGRNWGYGATLAIEDGAIVMILERMNRILEVNEELAYAVIEPGVSYEQFNAYLKERGHKLWIDCIDGTAQGSVIGNAMDRGVGETPYGDHFGNLCGLEVVLPDGTVVHTGEAVGGSKTWHTHKWGVGPYLEGMFTQSNLGIVTRAGIWLMPEPEAYNSYVFRNTGRAPPARCARCLSATCPERCRQYETAHDQRLRVDDRADAAHQRAGAAARAPLSAADLDALRRKYGISPWSCAGGIYGTRGQVRLQRRLLRRALGRYGRLIFVSNWQLPYHRSGSSPGRGRALFSAA